MLNVHEVFEWKNNKTYDIHWEKNEAGGDVINKIFYAFEPLM